MASIFSWVAALLKVVQPVQEIAIVGFVSVSLNATHGTKAADITFQCDVAGIGRSGDVNDLDLDYGTFGSVPVLVQ